MLIFVMSFFRVLNLARLYEPGKVLNKFNIKNVKAPTSSSPGRDGSTVVFEVQSAGCVKDWVHKDVCLTLLQHVQHLLHRRRRRNTESSPTFVDIDILELFLSRAD